METEYVQWQLESPNSGETYEAGEIERYSEFFNELTEKYSDQVEIVEGGDQTVYRERLDENDPRAQVIDTSSVMTNRFSGGAENTEIRARFIQPILQNSPKLGVFDYFERDERLDSVEHSKHVIDFTDEDKVPVHTEKWEYSGFSDDLSLRELVDEITEDGLQRSRENVDLIMSYSQSQQVTDIETVDRQLDEFSSRKLEEVRRDGFRTL
jgi:hypothetical protein